MAVTLTREGGVGLITLERPPVNAYDKPTLKEFADAIEEARADAQVRCVVVRSALEKFFSAGADISVMQGRSAAEFADFLTYGHEVLDMIENTPKVFIAAINGHCLGGGLEIALVCDLRFAAEGKYGIGLAEAKLGLSPGMGGTQRLPRLIGKGRALHLLITGDTVPPETAHEWGIVDRLFPAESFRDEVMAYAGMLAEGPSLTAGLIKLTVNQGMEASLAQGLALERATQNVIFSTEDAAEGIAAFLEKRKAKFKGK